MSSLSYSDEHLAWQQRVQKEITAAAGFFTNFEPSPQKSRISGFISRPIQLTESPQLFSKTLNFKRDLRSTNVHAEVRGKYARMPILNPRSQSTKHNVYESIFKESGKDQNKPEFQGRTRFLRLRSSGPKLESGEAIEGDIKEITRLLKIERIKRMIVQKKLIVQGNSIN